MARLSSRLARLSGLSNSLPAPLAPHLSQRAQTHYDRLKAEQDAAIAVSKQPVTALSRMPIASSSRLHQELSSFIRAVYGQFRERIPAQAIQTIDRTMPAVNQMLRMFNVPLAIPPIDALPDLADEKLASVSEADLREGLSALARQIDAMLESTAESSADHADDDEPAGRGGDDETPEPHPPSA